MPSEHILARQLVEQAMKEADQNPAFDRDMMGRAILNAVIAAFAEYRKPDDVASELRYLADNLDEDEFVITRGC